MDSHKKHPLVQQRKKAPPQNPPKPSPKKSQSRAIAPVHLGMTKDQLEALHLDEKKKYLFDKLSMGASDM